MVTSNVFGLDRNLVIDAVVSSVQLPDNCILHDACTVLRRMLIAPNEQAQRIGSYR